MKRLTLLIIGVLALTATASWSLTVTATPASYNVVQGMEVRIPVIYRGDDSGIRDPSYTSPEGSFTLASGEIIGIVRQPLTLDLRAGTGAIAETVTVPVAIVERTLERGANSFVYGRTFAGASGTAVTSVSFKITGEAAAAFSIKRFELYFDKKLRSIETSVDQYAKGLKAYAEIRFVGSGNLRGYWEVDGRVLAPVNRHLTAGPAALLEIPDTPPLPTFEAGTHLVRFIVTSPAIAFELPTIVYTVVPAKSKPLLEQVLTTSPAPGAELDFLPPTVSWNRLAGGYLYEVEFIAEPEGRPVFNAYAKEPFYTVPLASFSTVFVSSRPYWWRVKVLDDDGAVLGESPWSSFRFKELP